MQELDELAAAHLPVHEALLQLPHLGEAAAVDGILQLTGIVRVRVCARVVAFLVGFVWDAVPQRATAEQTC